MIIIIHINISDFQVNNSISGIYRISDIRIKQARNGNTYIKAVLFDATGYINIIYWEYDGTPINPASELVSVIGNVGTYMGSPQFTAESFQLLTAEDCQTIEMNGLVPSAPIDVDLYQLRLSNLVRSISEPSIYDVCVQLFRENWKTFINIPAAQFKHHAFLHGLLMHTVDTGELADTAARTRPGVNRDLLLGGVLLHDIGKIHEFECSVCTGLVTAYSEKGQLIGHAAIGFEMIGRAAQAVGADPHIVNQLQFMVLMHHSLPSMQPSSQPPMVELELLRKLDAADSGCESCLESRRRGKFNAIASPTPATSSAGGSIGDDFASDNDEGGDNWF